tara:strand:- start:6777 stop:6983 length:207 start_codon:yes stop_codon:yes gene_type:complete
MALNISEIVGKLETLKTAIGNEDITMADSLEFIEDLLCDIQGDGCFDFQDDDHYGSFEQTDFTKLEIM